MRRTLWSLGMLAIAAGAYLSRPPLLDAQPTPCGGHCTTGAPCTAECWYCKPNPESIEHEYSCQK